MSNGRIEYDYGIAKHIREGFGKTKRMWWEPKGTRMADLPLWNGDLLRESRFDNEPVLLVEGEKDANRGVMFGVLAVSFAGGSSQRDFGKAPLVLANREIVLVPDQDKVGIDFMRAVAPVLIRSGVARLRWLDLPFGDMDDHGNLIDHDLSDFLDEVADEDPRGAIVALRDMIEAADVIYQR